MKKPFYKRAWFIALAVIVVIGIIGAIGGGGNTDDTETTTEIVTDADTTDDSEDEASTEDADAAEDTDAAGDADSEDADGADEEAAEIVISTDDMTTAQKNAYQSAKSYLNYMAFSRQGLIDQLTSEYADAYALEDATYAVDALEANSEVDWNEEAYESAKSYLDYMAFSRQGLIDQLTSEYGEQFEADQAEYAVATLESNSEVDWNEEAYESAKSYLEYSSFSLDGLIEQLESEYGEQFTHEEAVYGAEKAYEE